MSDAVSGIVGENESAHEPDRLEGFLHPRKARELFGHEDAESELLRCFTSNRMHHAWLFAGAEGVGKATLAYRFARFLLSRNGEGSADLDDFGMAPDNPVFAQVAALAHPNLLVLRRPWQEKSNKFAGEITVGEARRLRRFFGHTAGAGHWRVVIIDRADELNSAAANSLLKNLEEPPPHCVFLLISAMPGRLPVTIRSRCRTLRFSPLPDDLLEKAVVAAYGAADLPLPRADTVWACLPLAQGSVSHALGLLENGGNELHLRLLSLLGGLPRLDHREVHKLADELTRPGSDQAYEFFFDIAGETLARIVSHAVTGQGAIGGEAELAARLNGTRALAEYAGLWETVRRAKVETDALNLDRKNLVLGTFFRLEETARAAFA
jgi:DNA polymerase-3 subunit delta'